MFNLSRRDFGKGGAALAALAAFQARYAQAFPSRADETVVPWLDQPAPNPVPDIIKNQLVWEDLDSWITPNDEFFSIAHFNRPVIEANAWRLDVDGLVEKPMTLTLDDIKRRPRQDPHHPRRRPDHRATHRAGPVVRHRGRDRAHHLSGHRDDGR